MRTVIIACMIMAFAGAAFAQSSGGKKSAPSSQSAYATCVANLQKTGISAREATKRCIKGPTAQSR